MTLEQLEGPTSCWCPPAYLLTTTFLVVSSLLDPCAALAQAASPRFSSPVNLSDSPGRDDAPAIAAAGANTVFVVWEDRGNALLLLSRSSDRGVTFTSREPVVAGDPLLSFGQAHVVSTGAGDVHVVFTVFDLVFGGAEILHAASTDGGDSFANVKLVSPLDEFNSYAPAISIGWATVLAWSDIDLWTGRTAIRVSLSDDDGATFTAPKRIDASNGGACCPSIVRPAC